YPFPTRRSSDLTGKYEAKKTPWYHSNCPQIADRLKPVTGVYRFCLIFSAKPLQSDANRAFLCLAPTGSSLKGRTRFSSFSQCFQIQFLFKRIAVKRPFVKCSLFATVLPQTYSKTPLLRPRV